MKLVENWRALFGASSVQIWSFTTFLEVAQQVVPLLDDYIPCWVTLALMLSGIAARFVAQPSLHQQDGADASK